MNTYKKWLFTAALFGSLVSSGTAFGADEKYWSHVFDATSDVTDAKGTSLTTRLVSDGKGHVLNQSRTVLGENSCILDYTKKTMATVLDTPQKVVLLTPLDDSRLQAAGTAKKKDVKELGAKTIEGHPCKGESYTTDKSKVEIWTGTDINYPVKTVVEQAGAKITTVLKSYTTNAPSDKLFIVPSTGYQVLKKDPVK